MATTNLQQWNPNQNNQETDAQYAADSQRTGGAANPSLFASVLSNKLFYQTTTYLLALFQSFANKGFTTSDASLAALTAQCAHFVTTADLRGDMQAVPYSPTLTLDCSKYNGFEITLTGNVSLTLANGSFGQRLVMALVQDSVGGHTATWPSNVISPGALSGTAGATNVQEFVYRSDNNFHPITPVVVS